MFIFSSDNFTNIPLNILGAISMRNYILHSSIIASHIGMLLRKTRQQVIHHEFVDT